ncbi:uncharacterized protein LOC115450634 [Manduca sexta]|nr:uncharacterized protein LOC115450634 [Manduca sexta]
MRPIIFFVLTILSCVLCKNNVKSLTQSLGQEVIEIEPPIKELPPGLEEEPSAENEQEEKTTTTIQPATKRASKITTVTQKTEKETKVQPVTLEDEEAKIEKELAEMYKDNADYKGDSSEVTNEVTPVTEDKPVARQRNFKFQPDLNNKADIERFRTSIDDISCDKRVTKKLLGDEVEINSASSLKLSFLGIFIWISTFYC